MGKNTRKPSYLIVVPCYNEEKRIYNTLNSLLFLLKKSPFKYQIAVMDDGSTDDTKKIVRKFKKVEYWKMPGPSRRENLALFLLHIGSCYDYNIYVDADLADYSTLLPLMLNLRLYPIVIGSRYLPASFIKRSKKRLFISKCMNGVTRLLFRTKIRDHFIGFKGFHHQFYRFAYYCMNKRNTWRSMYWDAEFLICAKKLEIPILEIPVKWQENKTSSLKITRDAKMLMYMVKLWMQGIFRF